MAVAKLDELSFKYQGNLGAHLIIGGVDVRGPHCIQLHGGYSFAYPYHTMGSGSLAAMGIFEERYKDNMTEEEAVSMCISAIEAGIYHDLGSGSNVDIAIIKKGKVNHIRGVKTDNKKIYSKPDGYTFGKDKIVVLEEYKTKIAVEEGEQPMDLS